jgi:hypothetical protein
MSIRNIPSLLWGASALALISCGPALEPASQPALILMGSIDPPPVHALLGHRTRLDLTPDQVAALDAIGQVVHQDNYPLIRRLREMRGDFRGRLSQEPRAGEPIPRDEEARTLTEQIRQNNEQAAIAVREALTPVQESQACTLFKDVDQDRRQLAERRMKRAQRGVGNRMRGATLPDFGAVWPWCAEEATDGSAVTLQQ